MFQAEIRLPQHTWLRCGLESKVVHWRVEGEERRGLDGHRGAVLGSEAFTLFNI